MTIRAVFEKGVFRPTEQVKLAEGTVVDLEIVEESVDVRSLIPPGTDEGLIQVYEILGRRLTAGITTPPNGMYSLKSSRGASKSEAINKTVPFIVPSFRSDGAGATSFATGCSFSVMTISSPGANRWIKSFSFACASSIVIVSDMSWTPSSPFITQQSIQINQQFSHLIALFAGTAQAILHDSQTRYEC